MCQMGTHPPFKRELTLSFPDGHAGPIISSRDKVRSGLATGTAKTPFYSDDFVVLLKT